MIEEMDSIKNPTIRERIERSIIKPIISSKAKFGLGVDTTQKKYKRSVKKKYGWIVPLKSKTGVDVSNVLNKIFKNSSNFHGSEGKESFDFSVDPKDLIERKCKKIWVGKGLEFYNKHVKALGVELYSTENEEKSCVVERWNRIMKDKMFKYFSANSTKKYIDVLDEMVNKYNNTKHSSIKMTPVEASDKKNENVVWLNLNGNVRSESVRPKFSIGDRVRITKKKGTFEKEYTPRWTEEVFTVSQIQFTDPPTYMITDDNNEEIQGTFYEQEMQKTDQNIFRIEKVIRKLKNKSLLKWYGYPDSFNSWVDNKELISLKN
ncbi:uncharacterized protein LOC136087893 [Hydra vulgaris]|uniref:Uncharacterized protein LOC136087893 n=1 Tax=Hydra vulgaris TaxID=6087 RepID=A0ABM4D031_HYDVU